MIPHPPAQDLAIDLVLAALADPQRRAILRQIGAAQRLICSDVAPDLPRSTVSVHLKRLREAGLIRQERQGQLIANELRDDGARLRFPGLLEAISEADRGSRTEKSR